LQWFHVVFFFFNFDNLIVDLVGFADDRGNILDQIINKNVRRKEQDIVGVEVHLLMSNGENKKKAKNGFSAD
jgi:hypothetical protein